MESLSFATRLHALHTDSRTYARGSMHAYVQLMRTHTATPVWLLHARTPDGQDVMPLLEQWVCAWTAPEIGVIGCATWDEWARSPLVLCDEALDGAEPAGDADDVLDLHATLLQRALDAFWDAAAAARRRAFVDTSAAAAAPAAAPIDERPPGTDMAADMRWFVDKYHDTLPLPADGALRPTFTLERVHLAHGEVLFYDCWHALAPACDAPLPVCAAGAPLSECLADVAWLLVHDSAWPPSARVAYEHAVTDALGMPHVSDAFARALRGLDARDADAHARVLDDVTVQHYTVHGHVVVRDALPPIEQACPCANVALWLHATQSEAWQRVVSDLQRLRDVLSAMRLVRVIPYAWPDPRVSAPFAPYVRTACTRMHQAPLSLHVPCTLYPDDAHNPALTAYQPLPVERASEVVETFNVITQEDEERLCAAASTVFDASVEPHGPYAPATQQRRKPPKKKRQKGAAHA
jgi:hypothetical protein